MKKSAVFECAGFFLMLIGMSCRTDTGSTVSIVFTVLCIAIGITAIKIGDVYEKRERSHRRWLKRRMNTTSN